MTRHLETDWHAPIHRATAQAFDALVRRLDGRPLVLDSGCGTAFGTRQIAGLESDAWVVGIDRSEHRLRRSGHRHFPVFEDNLVLVRAELSSFWRLALSAGWTLTRHYLLYPNPYPKATQLKRRWHGHPAFPALLALGGAVELRSNWRPYVDEFACALRLAGVETSPVHRLRSSAVTTRFEQKYRDSGHALWRLTSGTASYRLGIRGCAVSA